MKLGRQMPLNALRVFEAVARLMSFTRAGEELGMTQTAVSYQVKLLEGVLGELLFRRLPRRIELTEAGERLLPKVSEAFVLLGEAMAAARTAVEEQLVINTTPTFAAHWLARRIGNFQLGAPNIAVRLITDNTPMDFGRDPGDVAIRFGRGNWPGLVAHHLMDLDFAPMLSPSLLDRVKPFDGPRDLLKCKIIDPGDPWWPLWFEAAGVPDANLEGRQRNLFGSQTLEASSAIAGHGVAILTPTFYREELASGRLVMPFDLVCSDESAYWLVYPENRRSQPKIRAFRDWLLRDIEKNPP
ncbi:LysR substrate-binding domain-containing protein [Pleomorphomonas sp. JP5]|uniref:LysR substrate-binding domain-containing protein n=1 Tax=Pleomorphomonas sp. JP5 TaxID=2942998 RepID=UPI002044001E|nr:LysR substrate-binding domain-containing protein [Pleomorphomonas sp. JP5]MCM5558745.1 LysR substrate-binding domain-containing protein [Pleomorphomonas sp. JP5]